MEWWMIWLAVMVVSLIIEFSTTDLVSVWFAVGGFVSLILSLCGIGDLWFVYIPVFIVVSFGCLLGFRKLAIKKFNKTDAKVNADSAIGKDFTLLTPIAFNQAGSIKVNDVIWTAVTEVDGEEIKEGTVVTVKAIKGNKYIVKEKK